MVAILGPANMLGSAISDNDDKLCSHLAVTDELGLFDKSVASAARKP